MASKNKNPYSKGSKYAGIFDAIRVTGQKGVTRLALVGAGFDVSSVTVVLSSRAEGSSTRGGDCRGNMSSQGHLYFVEKRKKTGEEARFILRWRKTPLDKRVRPPKKNQASQKAKTTKTVKAKTAKAKTVKAVAKTAEVKTAEVTA